MTEKIAAVLERLGSRPERFDELRAMLADAALRQELLDYTDEVTRGTSARFAAKELDRTGFYAVLVQREVERMKETEYQEGVAAIDTQLDLILSSVNASMPNEDTRLLLIFTKYLAVPLNVKGKFKEGVELYERLWQRAKNSGNSVFEILAGKNYGEFLSRVGRFDEAYRILDQACMLARESDFDDEIEYAGILSSLGHAARLKGRGDEAIGHFETCLAAARKANYLWGIVASLGNLGNVYICIGLYEKARIYYEESLVVARELGNPYLLAALFHNVASVLKEQGNFDQARRQFEEALKLNKQIGNLSFVSKNFLQLGNLNRDQGHWQQAQECYRESRRISEITGAEAGMAVCTSNLGMLAFDQEQYDKARNLLTESLAAWKEIGGPLDIAAGLRALCEVAIAEGDYVLAEEYCTEARNLSGKISDLIGTANALLLQADLYLERKELGSAASCLCDALHKVEEIGNLPKMIIGALRRCGLLLSMLGNPRGAMLLSSGVAFHQQRIGLVFSERVQRESNALHAGLLAELAPDQAAIIQAQAEAMSLEELTDYALNALHDLQLNMDGELSESEQADQPAADQIVEAAQHDAGRDAHA